MNKRMIASLAAALLLAGCTGQGNETRITRMTEQPVQAGTSAMGSGQAGPGSQESQQAGDVPLKQLADLDSIQIPWPKGMESYAASGLHVSPSGKSYALRFILQGEGLLVWREGDREGVKLSGLALPEVAWTSFGLYFVQLTAPMDGKPQIMRYHWGEAQPAVVLEGEQLKGYPRGLYWSQGSGLVFSDDEGPKMLAGDQKAERLKGLPLPMTLRGEAFSFKGLRYITAVDNRLAMVSAVDGRVYDLGEQAVLRSDEMLLHIRWDQTGQLAAVEAGGHKSQGRVAWIQAPEEGQPRLHSWTEGSRPAWINGALYFTEGQTVLERGVLDVAPVAHFEKVGSLTADPAGRRLFVLPPVETGGKLYYLPR